MYMYICLCVCLFFLDYICVCVCLCLCVCVGVCIRIHQRESERKRERERERERVPRTSMTFDAPRGDMYRDTRKDSVQSVSLPKRVHEHAWPEQTPRIQAPQARISGLRGLSGSKDRNRTPGGCLGLKLLYGRGNRHLPGLGASKRLISEGIHW